MQTESNIKPSENFVLENYIDGNVDIVFFNNVKEEERIVNEQEEKRTQIVYLYDTYRVTKRNRSTLKLDIEKNYDKYLKEAIDYEKTKSQKSIEERNWRNSELDKTDKYLLEDFPIKYEKSAILKYREALREYPEQEGFPYDSVRPKIEDFV